MALPCTLLRPQLLFPLLLLLLIGSQQLLALEFMDADDSAAEHEDEGDSAELPTPLHSYTKDTIANFNPHKQDAHFRTLWEQVPLQKQEVIKRR